jgi:hypothetical protein
MSDRSALTYDGPRSFPRWEQAIAYANRPNGVHIRATAGHRRRVYKAGTRWLVLATWSLRPSVFRKPRG